MKISDIKNERAVTILADRYLPEYKKCINRIKNRSWTTLGEISSEVTTNNEPDIQDGYIYRYVETGNVYKDIMLEMKKLRGWSLPDRAKLTPKDNSILLSKMNGSFNNFVYLNTVEEDLIFSNGFYSVTIPNELDRYNFLKFMFSDDYLIQMRALTSGTIMSDVKKSDLLKYLFIPNYDQDSNYKEIKEYLKYKEYFDKYRKQ